MDLRKKIAEIISPWLEDYDYHADDIADDILAIPELKEALKADAALAAWDANLRDRLLSR